MRAVQLEWFPVLARRSAATCWFLFWLFIQDTITVQADQSKSMLAALENSQKKVLKYMRRTPSQTETLRDLTVPLIELPISSAWIDHENNLWVTVKRRRSPIHQQFCRPAPQNIADED